MTEQFLQELITKYRVPVHVQKHMKKVAAVSLFIADCMIKNATAVQSKNQSQAQIPSINITVLQQAALLHDFMKLCDFPELHLQNFQQTYTADDIQFWTELIKNYHTMKHVRAAYEILKELGEDEIAIIVKKHGFNSLIHPDENERPQTWEEKILYYADKRVRHDQVVTIQERLHDGRTRYFPDGDIPETDAHVEKELYKLEKELLHKANLKPEDINEKSVEQYLRFN